MAGGEEVLLDMNKGIEGMEKRLPEETMKKTDGERERE